MLQPKKTKYRKYPKGRRCNKGVSTRGNELAFGSFGLKIIETKWITQKQIEAARKAIVHHTKRGGKLWIRIFPDKPVTRKGTEVPMGGGKGMVEHFVAPVKKGRIIFELEGVTPEIAKLALIRAAAKLPVKTKVIESIS